jgi:hypothetical protein
MNEIDKYVNSIFELYKDIGWCDELKKIFNDQSIKLARFSNYEYDDILDLIKAKFNKKLQVYLLENQISNTPIKKKTSIFHWFKKD